jgi:hypothetical protein
MSNASKVHHPPSSSAISQLKFQQSKHISFNTPDLNMKILPSVIRALLCYTPVWGDTSVARDSFGEREKEVIRVSQ